MKTKLCYLTGTFTLFCLAQGISSAWAQEGEVLTKPRELDLGLYQAMVDPNGTIREIRMGTTQMVGKIFLVAYPKGIEPTAYNQVSAVAGKPDMPEGARVVVQSNATTVSVTGLFRDRGSNTIFQYQSQLLFRRDGLVDIDYQVQYARECRWDMYGPSLSVSFPTNRNLQGWVAESAQAVQYGFFGAAGVCIEVSNVRVETEPGILQFTAGKNSYLRGDPGHGNFCVHSMPRTFTSPAGTNQALHLAVSLPMPAKTERKACPFDKVRRWFEGRK